MMYNIDQLKILIAPDNQLKKISKLVEEIDSNVELLVKKMLHLMYESNGIGLAAPQVGILKRIIVMDCSSEEEENRPYFIINPKVISSSDTFFDCDEGCLSLPNHYASVSRPDSVNIKFQNEKREFIEKVFTGLEATCIQHEIDHLNGILFVDHISRLKRSVILKKLEKYKKNISNNSF